MDERINILPFNGSNDTATAMAMMNNNPFDKDGVFNIRHYFCELL